MLLFLFLGAHPALGETVKVAPGEVSLTEALEQCSDGDVIFLETGVYEEPEESFPLIIDRAVTVCAAEGETPVIDAPEFQPAFRIEADGVTLRGLDIRMRRTGIYAVGDRLTMEDCRISLAEEQWRTSSCGMWCGGIRGMELRNCDFTGCGVSLAGPPLSESSSSVPVLTGLFEVGEEEEFFTSHTIENCRVNGRPLYYAVSKSLAAAPEDAGQVICCGCEKVIVKNADVSDGSMGMVLAYNDQVIVENCRADQCGVFGIYAAKCEGGIVRNCRAEQTNHGIDIRASKNFSLIDCSAADCDQGLFFSHVEGSIMTGCRVTGTGQGYFMAGGSGNAIYSCSAEACENGFNLQKEGSVLMTDCRITGCTVCGVRLDWTPAVFSENCLEGNWVGVMAYGEVSFDMTGNRFSHSGSCALYLKDIQRSRFMGNVFAGSEGESVQAEGRMEQSLWAGNILDKPIKTDTEAEFFTVF